MNEISQKTGKRVKELLTSKGIKQQDFAAEIHISQKHLSNIINGRKSLTQENARLIASKFSGVREAWLLGFDDFKTEEEFDEYINEIAKKAVEQAFEEADAFDALFKVAGYPLVGEYEDIPVPAKSRDALGTDVLENTLVSYAFLHDGVKVASGCKETEITALQNDILDFARLWIERFIQQKAGAGNASK